jgi:hypothetical protein
MPRPSFGSESKEQAKKLLKGLLDFANGAVEQSTPLPIQIHWQSDRRLVVRTKVRTLEQLLEMTLGVNTLNKSQIKETLKRLKDFLGLLEDNRTATQGAEDWHFTLKLWHPRHATEANLNQFDLEWDSRRAAKYQRNPIPSPLSTELESIPQIESRDAPPNPFQDWGEAIDSATFYGRTEELKTLKQWLLIDRCRLIMIGGMGGIGKTAIATKLCQHVQSEFEYIFWRSLRNAPPFHTILSELIAFVSHQQETQLPETIESITRFSSF